MSHGTLQKKIQASHLGCFRCSHFHDDDPDVFYCDLAKAEFPDLCVLYNTERTHHVPADCERH